MRTGDRVWLGLISVAIAYLAWGFGLSGKHPVEWLFGSGLFVAGLWYGIGTWREWDRTGARYDYRICVSAGWACLALGLGWAMHGLLPDSWPGQDLHFGTGWAFGFFPLVPWLCVGSAGCFVAAWVIRRFWKQL